MKDQLLDGEYLITAQYMDWMVKTGGYARDITLRDHFAGLAMQGLTVHNIRESYAEMAEKSYTMAEAMLKERAK